MPSNRRDGAFPIVLMGAHAKLRESSSVRRIFGLNFILLMCASAALAQNIDPRIAKGRVLASNCTQCHSTNGQSRSNSFDSLVGKSYAEIKKDLMEMKTKTGSIEPDDELMVVHAKAYTDDELDAIAYFLSLP